MLLRRSTTYALFLAIALSAAATFYLIRSDPPLASRLPLKEGDLAAGRPPVRVGKAGAGGSTVLGETDAEFGILPIGLGSPVEHDMLEEDGIAFVPDRPEGADLPPQPLSPQPPTPPVSGGSGLHIEPVEPDRQPSKGKDSGEAATAPASADFPYKFDSALLASRLAAFLARPVLSHAAALAANVAACPLAIHDRQVNPDQLRGEREGWAKVTERDIEARRKGLVEALERAGKEGERLVGDPKATSGGRGLVVAGGNRVSEGPRGDSPLDLIKQDETDHTVVAAAPPYAIIGRHPGYDCAHPHAAPHPPQAPQVDASGPNLPFSGRDHRRKRAQGARGAWG